MNLPEQPSLKASPTRREKDVTDGTKTLLVAVSAFIALTAIVALMGDCSKSVAETNGKHCAVTPMGDCITQGQSR